MNQGTMTPMIPMTPPPRRRLSTGAKVGIGCGVTFVIAIVLMCAGVFFAVRWGIRKLDEFAQTYEKQGYVRVNGQIIDLDETVDRPTVFTGQTVVLRGDATASVAIMAQTAEIRGRVDGNLDFFGQTLLIRRDAVITGDLNVKGAQIVTIDGVVEGKVTGSYGEMRTRPESGAGTSEAPEPAAPAEPAAPPGQD